MTIHRRRAGFGMRRRQPRVHRPPARPVQLGIRGAALAAIALLVGMGWPLPIPTTLLLGSAIVLWMVGNFAIGRPGGSWDA
jgi:hypothetical protein